MKNKFLLPLLAVLFAVAGAFATLPVQTGWFKTMSGSVTSGTITTPPSTSDIICLPEGEHICKVGNANAYDSPEDAEAGGEDGLLRYDNN